MATETPFNADRKTNKRTAINSCALTTGEASVSPNQRNIVLAMHHAETAPDGNQVILEEQMVRMNETVTNHGLVTEIYRKQLGMFKTAARGGGR